MSKQYRPKNWYYSVINMAKSQLDIEESTYREILHSTIGKTSLTEMSIPELFKVLNHLKGLGFKLKTNKKLSPSTKSKNELTMLDKLRQVWIEMSKQGFLKDGSEQALEKWSVTQSKRFNNGVAVNKLKWLKGNMIYTLIEQLKQWHMRLLKNAIPKAYTHVRNLHIDGELNVDEIDALNGYKAKLMTAPETHALNSGLYCLYLKIIENHKSNTER